MEIKQQENGTIGAVILKQEAVFCTNYRNPVQ